MRLCRISRFYLLKEDALDEVKKILYRIYLNNKVGFLNF